MKRKFPKFRYLFIGIIVVYIVISITPIKREIVRLNPSYGGYFYPPLFYYAEDFDSGRVGTINIGDRLDEVTVSIESRYGKTPSYEMCADDSEVRLRQFSVPRREKTPRLQSGSGFSLGLGR